jgi:glutathione S-transferase
MSLPKLVYFSARGRAELIRLILSEAGVGWEEENFGAGEVFAALKESGRLPFNAVPVWEEPDGFRLAQSVAIANHLARAYGLYGKTPREHALCDQMIGAFEDVRAELRKVALEPARRAELRAALESTVLPRWFSHLDRLLASNHGGEGFLVGDSITMADLALWYLLELSADNGFAATFADHPRLEQFARRIGARPRIAAYLSSPKRFPLLPLPK